MNISAVLLALVTLAAGLIAGWAIARSRSAADSSGSAAATATLGAERDAAVAERERSRAEHEAEANRVRAERDAEADRLRTERDEVTMRLRDAELRAQQALTRLEQLQHTEDQLKTAESQLKDSFARLSSEALERSNTQFLALADDRFRQAGRPLTESLTKVEAQLREIEKTRLSTNEVLAEQIDVVRRTGDALRQETTTLVNALRKPQARGRWGELQLRRCVEFAGMTDRCDFTEQTSVSTADGMLRPDLVVRLVGGKNIVVDSKVTLAAYIEAYETADESVREERLDAHARHLRKHVNDLGSKAYWTQFSPSPEFVVLFVPGEAFLAPALDRDPSLLEDALAKGVHIVTPTTLVSTLRTVAYTWQQDALAANAAAVFELGRELYSRLGTMGGHVDKLGRQLTGAVNAYNDTVRSLESRVLVTARKLNELEVIDTPLEERTLIAEAVRPVGAPELVESAEQSRAVVALPSAALPSITSASPAADDADDQSGQGDLLARADDYGLGTAEPAAERSAERRA